MMIRTVGTLPTHLLAELVHAGILELVDRGVISDAAETPTVDLTDEQLQAVLGTVARILGVASRHARAIANIHQPTQDQP
jgi:hypothetical protein